jgi:predicted nucleic acid-binding protein
LADASFGQTVQPIAQPERGLLDTNVLINVFKDSSLVGQLPMSAAVSAVSLAELSFGVASAKTAAERSARSRQYGQVKKWFNPLPFDESAADLYGTLVGLVIDFGRDPKPRRVDLMIAAVAAANNLPLVTANPSDFKGLGAALTILPVSSPGVFGGPA